MLILTFVQNRVTNANSNNSIGNAIITQNNTSERISLYKIKNIPDTAATTIYINQIAVIYKLLYILGIGVFFKICVKTSFSSIDAILALGLKDTR